MSTDVGDLKIVDDRLVGRAYIWHLELTSGREISILSEWSGKYRGSQPHGGFAKFYRVKETTTGAQSFTYEIVQVEEVWVQTKHICLSARGQKGIQDIDCVVVAYRPRAEWERAAQAIL